MGLIEPCSYICSHAPLELPYVCMRGLQRVLPQMDSYHSVVSPGWCLLPSATAGSKQTLQGHSHSHCWPILACSRQGGDADPICLDVSVVAPPYAQAPQLPDALPTGVMLVIRHGWRGVQWPHPGRCCNTAPAAAGLGGTLVRSPDSRTCVVQ